MKLYYAIFALILTLFTTSAQALLPPKYLSVPNWKHCLSTVKKDTARFVCLPDAKPPHCPIESWQTLTDQKLVDKCTKEELKR